jgi:hypothetical protein
VSVAKEKGEIQSDIPDENIAVMFLNLSGGIALNRMIVQGELSTTEMKQDWDNLYALLRRGLE